jgi:cysteine-rich repeat protein
MKFHTAFFNCGDYLRGSLADQIAEKGSTMLKQLTLVAALIAALAVPMAAFAEGTGSAAGDAAAATTTTTTLSVCGNAVLEGSEECDDGNNVNTDSCTNACTDAVCGDSIVGPGEECDDGNLVDGDGCDSNCTLTACGNGILTEGEDCDDGNTVSGDGCTFDCLEALGCCTDGSIVVPSQVTVSFGCFGSFFDGYVPTCVQPVYHWNSGFCGTLSTGSCSDPTVDDDGDGFSEAEGDCCDSVGTYCHTQVDCYYTCFECTPASAIMYPASPAGIIPRSCCGDGCPNPVTHYDATCGVTQGVCGNGALQAGEECDDGNLIDYDGCEDDCRFTVCANSTGALDISYKPRLSLKRINTDPTSDNDALSLKGGFTLPGTTEFAHVDPVANGVRFVIESQDGSRRVDVAIPAGAFDGTSGWKVNGARTKFQYKDKAKPPASNGINKVLVQDRSNKVPNRVRVQVKGKFGSYLVVSGDEPVKAIVVVGDGELGECGETAFSAEDCEFNGAETSLRCRQ